MMANRSDGDEDNLPNVQGIEARKAEWDLVRGNHQGQRSMTARTGRTQDSTRPARQTVTDPLATREPSTQDSPLTAKSGRYDSSGAMSASALRSGHHRSPVGTPRTLGRVSVDAQ